jgi:Fe-S oxidoreductase
MTITYDQLHPLYVDEFDVRNETTRVFDVCFECALCLDHCGVFPLLSQIIGQNEARDAGLLTPHQQDIAVDLCTLCHACVDSCPFTPGHSDLAIDFQGLVERQRAMRLANGQGSMRQRAKHWVSRFRFLKK